MKQIARKSLKYLSALGTLALMQPALLMAQTLPQIPLPSGVSNGSNPIDTGVNLLKYGARYGFFAISVIGLLVGAYYGIPIIQEWLKGKKTIGEAVGVMVGLLILIIFVIAIANYGFQQVGAGGAATP